mmetsp:Transcript_782/g.2537  ORF Transcript_782/g.2537 Transcript_782/m.2537 type:complete len:300 (-) Transcript_782:537-1436(-)
MDGGPSSVAPEIIALRFSLVGDSVDLIDVVVEENVTVRRYDSDALMHFDIVCEKRVIHLSVHQQLVNTPSVVYLFVYVASIRVTTVSASYTVAMRGTHGVAIIFDDIIVEWHHLLRTPFTRIFIVVKNENAPIVEICSFNSSNVAFFIKNLPLIIATHRNSDNDSVGVLINSNWESGYVVPVLSISRRQLFVEKISIKCILRSIPLVQRYPRMNNWRRVIFRINLGIMDRDAADDEVIINFTFLHYRPQLLVGLVKLLWRIGNYTRGLYMPWLSIHEIFDIEDLEAIVIGYKQPISTPV